MDFFIMFCKFLETHPCTGRTVWGTHMAQLLHSEPFALGGQSLKIVKLRACNQWLVTVIDTFCDLL